MEERHMEKKGGRESKGVMVFVEIQDHERVLEGARELLTKGRGLADRLGEKVYAVVLALEAEKYLADVKNYGPDFILYMSHNDLKHYNSEIFPELFTGLIKEYNPSILLIPSTEAGSDLAPRLSQRFHTGLTAHCTGLDIIDSDEHGEGLLLMKRPAFSGNMVASIICPESRPQIATVQPGVFEKAERTGQHADVIELAYSFDTSSLRVVNCEAPRRWDRCTVPLEQADVVVAGGRGLGAKCNFDRLFELSQMLGGEVGATRVPVFNGWCGLERMIGQTGKTVKPRLYMGFGISGQIQHTTSIVDAEIIVSVNADPGAPIFDISDYVIQEDAARFLEALIERLKKEKLTFACGM